MELYAEILASALSGHTAEVRFPGLELNAEAIVEGECYRALQSIKRILEDDTLEDAECFLKIEGIVRVFEALGSGAGWRHDDG